MLDKEHLISFGVAMIILVFIGYIAFFKRFKNNQILIDDMKIQFTKYSLFDKQVDQTIYWNGIVSFGVITAFGTYGKIQEILVKSLSGKEFIINPKDYKKSIMSILEMIKSR